MAGQGSARVTLREIDLSQVRNPQEQPQGVPAAVVGPARKGPAFVPQTFANMQQFSETFGSMLDNRRESNSNLFGPLALNEWMRNARAGTYLRVLGVGDGKKSDSYGKVTDAGFVVGSQQVHATSSGPGKLSDNPFTTVSDVAESVSKARTHFLGCFMKDVAGSRFLCDADVQKETAQAEIATANRITINSPVNGDEMQIFLPKELVNKAGGSVEEDVTLTIVIKTQTEVYTDIPKDTIQIKDNADATIATNLLAAINANKAAGIGFSATGDINTGTGANGEADKNFIFSSLSFNPSLMFDTTGSANAVIALKLPAGREGDEAFIVETAGTATNLIAGITSLNQKVFFSGASQAAPVIRGVLMAPQGVIPTLNPTAALNDKYSDVSEATSDQIRAKAHTRDYGDNPVADLIGYVVGEVGSSQEFKLILNGFSNSNKPAVLDCSFDPNSPSYISKVLNTDPTKIEECGHFLYAHWDIDPAVAIPANDNLSKGDSLLSENASDSANFRDMIGFLVAGAGGHNTSSVGKPNYENFESRFQTAHTPWVVSQFFSKGADSSPRPSSASAGEAYKLFRLHALDDGEVGNTRFRLLVENLRYDGLNKFGAFDMSLEAFDLDPINGQTLVAWKNLSLNPDDRNFIGRVIGDRHIYFNFNKDESKQRLESVGNFEVKNKFVRVELSDDLLNGEVPVEALPTGFQGHTHLSTSSAGNFIEPTIIAVANRVYTNAADDAVTETLSKAEVLPLDYVKSINRVIAGSLEADDDLAWGVKFAKRGFSFDSSKELVEQEFNKSIVSWTKYFPALDLYPAAKSGDDADSFQKSMFSLEKILIPSSSIVSDAISSWDGAEYQRKADSITPATGARYVNIAKDATGGNVRYLKFRCLFQGGFDGVNIFDKEKAELTGVASLRESQDETGTSKFIGPTIASYRKAIDVLSDKSATEFQLLAIPGQRASSLTDYAISACEERFDALFVMDILSKDNEGQVIESDDVKPSVRQTIKEFSDRVLNTSFAAAYFPDVLMRRPSDRAPIVVPPSVGMMGVMSRNDSIADPWFAPAGLSRGRLSAIDSNVTMNRDLLDELYDADINPIYVPAGRPSEVYAFGQKTLLQDQSALDRINVRRLLIDIRRKVRKVGEQLLFEPNRASTLQRFESLVKPIMENVKQRRGVTRYKVQIDSSTTTQNDIENNTIRGKIYLQPTKSVEFISLDFVVTNTIQD